MIAIVLGLGNKTRARALTSLRRAGRSTQVAMAVLACLAGAAGALLVATPVHATPPDAFIFTIDTTKTQGGSSPANAYRLPLVAAGTYDATVDWGDGTAPVEVTSHTDPDALHTYATGGAYTVTIAGTLRGWSLGSNTGDALKFGDVRQWGVFNPGNAGGLFRRAFNMTASATDAPDMTGVWNLREAFFSATSFNGAIGNWDTSMVTDMSSMFSGASVFNQPLGSWNTANATTMNSMFNGARSFNQPLASWNTARVTNMMDMFNGATAFNQPLGAWDTSNVTTVRRMFLGATAFNQPLGAWNASRMNEMRQAFQGTAMTDANIRLISGWRSTWNWGGTTASVGLFSRTGVASSTIQAFRDAGWPLNAYANLYALPDPPAAPVVVVDATTSTTAGISWTVPADGGSPITGYELTLPSGTIVTVPASQTTYTLIGLAPGSTGVVSVKAVNSVGAGPAGTTTVVTPRSPAVSGGGGSAGGAGTPASTNLLQGSASNPPSPPPLSERPAIMPSVGSARVVYRQMRIRGSTIWQPVVRVGKPGAFRYVKPKDTPTIPAGALVTVVTSGDPAKAPSRNVPAARRMALLLASSPGVKVYDGTVQGKFWRNNARIIANW